MRSMSSRPARWWCVRSRERQLSWMWRTRDRAAKKAGPTSSLCSAATCACAACWGASLAGYTTLQPNTPFCPIHHVD
eukprot:1149075-Pelagomonas_calceolata.AAC.1